VGSTGGALSTGATAVQRKETPVGAQDVDAASSIGNSIARAFLFLGLLALIGAVSFKLLVLRAARAVPIELKQRMSQRAATLGMISAVVVIVVALVRLNLESQMMSAMPDMPGMKGMDARGMVMQTDWGFAFRIQLAAALAALLGFGLAARRVRGGWFVATASALILAITPALGGHAAASPRFTSLMIAADWLHVLGGATWLGSLLCVMAIGVPIALTLELENRWGSIASLVNAFSPLALASAGVVVASGVFASWIRLEHLSALWQTTYGKTLVVKLLLVAITFGIGAYNFKRVQPQLVTEIGALRLRKSAAAELAVGFMILLVTGLLTGVSP
jgi:putative copper export protein